MKSREQISAQPEKHRRTVKKALLGAATVCAGALALPMVLAAPADAAAWPSGYTKAARYGCVADPRPPLENGRDPYDRNKIVRFRVKLTCQSDTYLRVQLQPMEEDGPPWYLDDPFGPDRPKYFYVQIKKGQTHTVRYDVRVPDWDDDHKADIYQLVSFQPRYGNEWIAPSNLGRSVKTVIPVK